ncbi:hypothetical protein F5Y14DRAFT_454715 [Nemania sp. NC0429]|nr:hypothetical protein F5Y14DRAFT_454715 [Nemania sp. NC0429]
MRAIDEDCDPDFEEESRDWTVLDDAASFDFDGDWKAALYLLPELAGPASTLEPYSHRHLGGNPEEVERLRGVMASCNEHEQQLTVDEMEAGTAGMELQACAVTSFLFVADAEAFETDSSLLRLLFLDLRGNIVRESRVPVADAWEMRSAWDAGKFRDGPFWADRHRSDSLGVPSDPGSVLGERYRATGDIGRELYKLDRLIQLEAQAGKSNMKWDSAVNTFGQDTLFKMSDSYNGYCLRTGQ